MFIGLIVVVLLTRSAMAQRCDKSYEEDEHSVTARSPARIVEVTTESSPGSKTNVSVRLSNLKRKPAPYKVALKSCPVGGGNGVETPFVILPPRGSQVFQLQLEHPLPGHPTRCKIQAFDPYRRLVASRKIHIRRHGQCSCTWGCLCTCIMAACPYASAKNSQCEPIVVPVAAGTTSWLDILLWILGFIIYFPLLLLLLGLLKAVIGLWVRAVASWGMAKILGTPRYINRYFEPDLKDREVVYDKNTWPVHPDTRKRTVHAVDWKAEFILNVLFFFLCPCCCCCHRICRTSSDYSQLPPDNPPTKDDPEHIPWDCQCDEMLNVLRKHFEDQEEQETPNVADTGSQWAQDTMADIQGYEKTAADRERWEKDSVLADLVRIEPIEDLGTVPASEGRRSQHISGRPSSDSAPSFPMCNQDAEELIERLRRAPVVFRNIVTKGIAYCYRGYFLDLPIGFKFVVQTPIRQWWYWYDDEFRRFESPRLLSADGIEVEYETAMDVLEARELSELPRATCLNCRFSVDALQQDPLLGYDDDDDEFTDHQDDERG